MLINKLKNIKLKRNKEILLILVLTALLIVTFALLGFLGIGQAETDTEQSTNSEEVLADIDKVETKSSQSEKAAKSNLENSFNNTNSYSLETKDYESVKGETTKSETKLKSSNSKTESPQTQFVVLEINTGTNSYSYTVSWQDDMNVYDALVSASEENKFSLVSSWYSAPLNSYYITEIHGYNCQCWTYKLKDKNNNEVPGSGSGVSLDTVDPGNIIIWKAT